MSDNFGHQYEFEDYTVKSKYYDLTRVPVGVKSVLEKEFSPSSTILDAGCGTGNYSCALAPLARKVVGFEFNDGMLDQARQKVKDQGISNVEFIQGSLLEKLPFANGSFDGIVINQVLHHLDDGSDPTFPNARALMKEFSRIIRPGGFVSINMTTREQANSFWWQHLMPRAQQVYANKHLPSEMLISYLKEAGLLMDKVVPCKEPLQGLTYFNPAAPLDLNFRNGDSTWSTLGKKELNEILNIVNGMLEAGVAGKFMDDHDLTRRELGQSTFFICRK